MPRKGYKKKSKSLCGMCKDYKTGGAKRWTSKELEKLRRYEQEKWEYEGKVAQD